MDCCKGSWNWSLLSLVLLDPLWLDNSFGDEEDWGFKFLFKDSNNLLEVFLENDIRAVVDDDQQYILSLFVLWIDLDLFDRVEFQSGQLFFQVRCGIFQIQKCLGDSFFNFGKRLVLGLSGGSTSARFANFSAMNMIFVWNQKIL